MENKVYNLKFNHCSITPSQLKEKDINQIIWILSQSRQTKNISLSEYGHIEFTEDDILHWNPIIIPIGKDFKRKGCECAIFDLHVERGNGQYNKLFVYHSTGKSFPYWGYVKYNTETKEMSSKSFIEDIPGIIQNINHVCNMILWNDTGRMKDKEKSIKNKNVDRSQYSHATDRYSLIYSELPTVTYIIDSIYKRK